MEDCASSLSESGPKTRLCVECGVHLGVRHGRSSESDAQHSAVVDAPGAQRDRDELVVDLTDVGRGSS